MYICIAINFSTLNGLGLTFALSYRLAALIIGVSAICVAIGCNLFQWLEPDCCS